MGEVGKTAYKTMRTIALSSRANLCINDSIKAKSKSGEDLNEKCLDLQKKPKDSRCPFLPAMEDRSLLDDFRDQAFATVHAIEDLEDLGRRSKTSDLPHSRYRAKC